MQCFGDLIAMEGTNANEPCRIGSIRPRRQARERRSLRPSISQVPSGKNNGFNAAVFTIVVLQFRPMRLPLMRNQLPTTSTPHLKHELSQFPHTEGDKCNFLTSFSKLNLSQSPLQ